MSLDNLKKYDKEVVMNLFSGMLVPMILPKDGNLATQVSNAYQDYINSVASVLNGHNWLQVIETARFASMAASSIREWEFVFESIVDLTKLSTKASLMKQLSSVATSQKNMPKRGKKASVGGIEDYLEKKKEKKNKVSANKEEKKDRKSVV